MASALRNKNKFKNHERNTTAVNHCEMFAKARYLTIQFVDEISEIYILANKTGNTERLRDKEK